MHLKDFTFTATPHMTVRQKQLVLGDWLRFLQSGLVREKFTKRLYHHLSLHCSFIAHFNVHGFYDTYFVRGDDTVQFLSQFDGMGPCDSVEYGGSWWRKGDYSDLACAMIKVATPLIPALRHNARLAQELTDLAIANALLAKHGRSAVQ